jgi:hypothetical protein
MRRSRLALIAGLTVFLTAMGATTGYALWSTSASTSAQVKAATVKLTSNKAVASTLAGPYRPGESNTEQVTLTNNGSIKVDVTAAVTLIGGGLPADAVALSVWRIEQGACSVTNVPSGAWTGTLAALNGAPSWPIAAGVAQSLCLRATLSASTGAADQGKSASATVTFTGTNGWTSAALVTVNPAVQAVFAPTPAAVPCGATRDGSNKYLLLTWTGSAAGYRVEYAPRSAAAPNPTSTPGNSVEISGEYFIFDGTGNPVTVTVRAVAANGWVSDPLTYTVWPGGNSTSNKKIYCSQQ